MTVKNIEISKLNKRRLMRGADAVEIKISYSDGGIDYLWNSRSDLFENLRQFPEFSDELYIGIDFYG